MSVTTSSIIPGKHYDTEKVLYITNVLQAQKYLQNSGTLVDILYTNTKNGSLVFVFERTPLMKELYRKWNAHEL